MGGGGGVQCRVGVVLHSIVIYIYINILYCRV